MKRQALAMVLAAIAIAPSSVPLAAQSLRGSRASVARMYRQARSHKLHFYETSAGVERAAERGRFVTLEPNSDFGLFDVSYPYVKPATRLFVKRLADEYHSACGERMTVTSAVRPESEQPVNSAAHSVHPTGMAVDIRRPTRSRCLRWLRSTLLSLEKSAVIEATEEHHPPHFHVAVYPTQYARYVARITDGKVTLASGSGKSVHVVKRGETLWEISRTFGTTVDALRTLNDISGDRIVAGQKLLMPQPSGGG